jgi:hypothetical protein
MSDDDLIRRGDALNAVQGWTYCCNAEDAIAALPAVAVVPVADALDLHIKLRQAEERNTALTPTPVDDSLAADSAVKPTLAEALTVPEVKALVEAANEHIAFMEGTGLTFDFLGKLRAALRQIGGEA